MRIGRKEALLTLVATMIPWMGRRAGAQEPRIPLKEPATSRSPMPSQEVLDLQRRVAALEAQLATQVGFTKDAAGNLRLRGNQSIEIESGTHTKIRAATMAEVHGGAGTVIKGANIALN